MSTQTPLPFVYGKRIEDIDVLARSPLLRGMPIQEVASLMDLLDQVALPAGTVVFREGDAAELMYFVLEGEARVKRGRLELRPLVPGDSFGEAALLASRPRTLTVETFSTMRLARLSRARYASFASRHPQSALHFTQALAGMLSEQVIELTDDVGLFARERTLPRQTHVRIRRGEDVLVVPTGTLVGSVLPREDDGVLVVGGLVDSRGASLEEAVGFDATLAPLTLRTPEGREIYRRSAALLALEAARRACPGCRVRAGSPLDNGQLLLTDAEHDRGSVAAKIQIAADALRQEDVPLREEVWGTDEARAHFLETGADDVAALLGLRREATVTLANCGGTFSLAMGPLLPRASFVSRLVFEPHPQGVLLRLPDLLPFMPIERGERVDPLATEVKTPRYDGAMPRAKRRWLAGLGVTSVGRFDSFCLANRVPELVRVAEGFHEKWLARIVDEIAERRDALSVIAVAGPSSSGKTTFIKRLTVQLLVEGIRPVPISLDDYYVDRERTVRDENGEYDFEAFEALDAPLLRTQISALLAGAEVRLAHYDFVRGKSEPAGGSVVQRHPGDVLLLEGIHGLDPALLAGVVEPRNVFRVFVHPATSFAFDDLNVIAPDDLRLLRRIVRDRHQRNYTAAATIARWPSVRSGELRRIYPYLSQADAIFDSALIYEPSILKTYAERYLLEVPPGDPASATAHRLHRLLDPFVTLYPDQVPANSVIREFIGGSEFSY